MRLPNRKPGKYMQTPKDHTITAAKLNELKKDLERLKKKQPGAAREVARLAEMGDFSENAEYQLAKGRLRGILKAIARLEFEISNAEVIPENLDNNMVTTGHTVTIKDDNGEKTYTILGSSEADPSRNIISQNSPLGAALLGKKVGDEVSLKVGGEERVFIVKNIGVTK